LIRILVCCLAFALIVSACGEFRSNATSSKRPKTSTRAKTTTTPATTQATTEPYLLPEVLGKPVGFLTADEEVKTFKLPEGLRVEVVAEEPMVQHPVAMSFDADGRMWVVEMRSYMPNMEGIG